MPATQYTRIDDVRIAYQVCGTGKTDIILIPGWVSNIEELWNIPEMAAWIRSLSSSGRLILFDKRGTGLSDRVAENRLPDLRRRMEDLNAVVEATGSKKPVLLGISEGVSMAIQFAVTYPENLSRLILYGGYARWIPDEGYPWGLSREQHHNIMEVFDRNWGTPVGFHLMAPTASGSAESREHWATYLRRSASPGTAIAFYRMNMEIDVRKVLPDIGTPTLILHRKDDRLIQAEHSQYIADHIPGARLHVLEGSDHLPWYGETGPLLKLIRTFIEHGDPKYTDLEPEETRKLYRLRKFLDENYHRQVTIRELSREFGLNEFKLKTGFRSLFNTSPIAYLAEIRLRKACFLIDTTNDPVAEISNKVGYNHSNNFSAAFKRRFGKTPGEWRKRSH